MPLRALRRDKPPVTLGEGAGLISALGPTGDRRRICELYRRRCQRPAPLHGLEPGRPVDDESHWANWRRINYDHLPSVLPALPIASIALHPANSNAIIVAFDGVGRESHLWRCDDTKLWESRWTGVGAGEETLESVLLRDVVFHPLRVLQRTLRKRSANLELALLFRVKTFCLPNTRFSAFT
jgi:hypothetical protein